MTLTSEERQYILQYMEARIPPLEMTFEKHYQARTPHIDWAHAEKINKAERELIDNIINKLKGTDNGSN